MKNILGLIVAFLCTQAVAAVENKKFVIVVTSYNNSAWYIKNLDSIFSQDYPHYRVIYLDDCSSDGTVELVAAHVKKRGQEHRFTLIKNTERLLAVANHYRAVQMCDDDEIVMQLDGDDWFVGRDVLSYFNTVYADPNVWITYGQYRFWPSGRMGLCENVARQKGEVVINWRKAVTKDNKRIWTPGQLRTFYAWLFKQIKVEDLIFRGQQFSEHKGEFYSTNYDVVFYFPMLEMAGERFKFISKVVYEYNVQTALNDFKVNTKKQDYIGKFVRSLRPYRQLKESRAGYKEQFKDLKADVIVFSSAPKEHEESVVRQLRTNIKKSDKITFWGEEEDSSVFIKALKYSEQDYILFIKDAALVQEPIDLSEAIYALENTAAYNVDFAVGKNQAESAKVLPLDGTMYCWNFYYASGRWNKHNTITAALYRKKDIIKQVRLMKMNSQKSFVEQWSLVKIDDKKIGLCFEQPCVVTKNSR